MKKIVKILSALLLCTGLVLSITSCAFTNTMKAEDYTGKSIKYSGSVQDTYTNTTYEYTVEVKDVSLTYYKSASGDYIDVYYTKVVSLESTSESKIETTPGYMAYTLYKDGKETFIYANDLEEDGYGWYDSENARIPVEIKGNDISFSIDWWDSNLKEVEVMNFNFTKAK